MNCRHVLLVAATAGLLFLQDGSASAQGAIPAAPALPVSDADGLQDAV